MHRQLHHPIKLWRIGDPEGRYPVWSGDGAALAPGRWNLPGQKVIYTAENYSLAMLEKLANWRGVLPSNQHFIRGTASAGCSYEVFQPARHIGWNAESGTIAAEFGGRWIEECRSALLFVPSVLAPMEQNVLLNPQHPDAGSVLLELETPVWWDARLFGMKAP